MSTGITLDEAACCLQVRVFEGSTVRETLGGVPLGVFVGSATIEVASCVPVVPFVSNPVVGAAAGWYICWPTKTLEMNPHMSLKVFHSRSPGISTAAQLK